MFNTDIFFTNGQEIIMSETNNLSSKEANFAETLAASLRKRDEFLFESLFRTSIYHGINKHINNDGLKRYLEKMIKDNTQYNNLRDLVNHESRIWDIVSIIAKFINPLKDNLSQATRSLEFITIPSDIDTVVNECVHEKSLQSAIALMLFNGVTNSATTDLNNILKFHYIKKSKRYVEAVFKSKALESPISSYIANIVQDFRRELFQNLTQANNIEKKDVVDMIDLFE